MRHQVCLNIWLEIGVKENSLFFLQKKKISLFFFYNKKDPFKPEFFSRGQLVEAPGQEFQTWIKDVGEVVGLNRILLFRDRRSSQGWFKNCLCWWNNYKTVIKESLKLIIDWSKNAICNTVREDFPLAVRQRKTLNQRLLTFNTHW